MATTNGARPSRRRRKPPATPMAAPFPLFTWDVEHHGARQVFVAALTGYCAAGIDPVRAVELANQALLELQRRAYSK